jgi:hypothetical protein
MLDNDAEKHNVDKVSSSMKDADALNNFLGTADGNMIKVQVLSQLVLFGRKLETKTIGTQRSVEDSDLQHLLTTALTNRLQDRFAPATADALLKHIDPNSPPPWLQSLIKDELIAIELKKLHENYPTSSFTKYCYDQTTP